jgi:hypothetical protein
MAKKPRIRNQVVLGLRATPQQRAWLNARATERGLSLQGLFEEIMISQANSPWLPSTETALAVPIDSYNELESAARVYRNRALIPGLIETLSVHIRELEKLQRRLEGTKHESKRS